MIETACSHHFLSLTDFGHTPREPPGRGCFLGPFRIGSRRRETVSGKCVRAVGKEMSAISGLPAARSACPFTGSRKIGPGNPPRPEGNPT